VTRHARVVGEQNDLGTISNVMLYNVIPSKEGKSVSGRKVKVKAEGSWRLGMHDIHVQEYL
jgi:hypothetical protein